MPEVSNQYQEKILEVLQNSNSPMSILEIEAETGISWATVKKHLQHLVEKGLILGIKVKPTRWEFRAKGVNTDENKG